MTTRRAVLVGVPLVALTAVVFTGRADDVARWLRVRPVPEVRASDRALLDRAVASVRALLDSARDHQDEAAAAILLAQLAGLGASDDGSAGSGTDWPTSIAEAAEERAEDATTASAPQLAQVLASLAAGLAQLAQERSV